MKAPTTAACFATYILPHVLFVDDFEERRRIVMICCLAWNISLFPEARQREEHIQMVWNMSLSDNPAPPPDGMEHGWKSDMRMLVAKKHDLFPQLIRRIPNAELMQQQPHNVLSVRTDDGDDQIALVTHPRVEGLPYIIPALQRMREDTQKQVETLQRIAQMPGALKKVEEPRIVTAYCAQRADLIGYHRMFTAWQGAQPDPLIKRGLGQWLGVLNEIEAHTKAVLGIIISALDA
ncbi:MAG: hypothetical protein JOZ29_09855 [Deltaproteobacteria bacterium]|nr:hypothetical protein [Deltaproteobacteria bacterium]